MASQGGVEALDVEGRVGLGIAQALRVLQAGLEGRPPAPMDITQMRKNIFYRFAIECCFNT